MPNMQQAIPLAPNHQSTNIKLRNERRFKTRAIKKAFKGMRWIDPGREIISVWINIVLDNVLLILKRGASHEAPSRPPPGSAPRGRGALISRDLASQYIRRWRA